MSRAIATKESVYLVADALAAEGSDPTIIAIQARVGGGSYSTVKRLLEEWRTDRAAVPTVTVLPPEIEKQAAEATRAVLAAASALAQREAGVVKEKALADAMEARRQLGEAVGEIERLEQVETDLARALDEERTRTRALELQVAALEPQVKRVAALEGELDAVRRETMDVAGLRAALDELRAQVAALVARDFSGSASPSEIEVPELRRRHTPKT
jgi:hypothetical protein